MPQNRDQVHAWIARAWSAVQGMFHAAADRSPDAFDARVGQLREQLERLDTADLAGFFAAIEPYAARLWSGAVAGSSMHEIAFGAVLDLWGRIEELDRTDDRLALVAELDGTEPDILGTPRFRETVVPDCLAAEHAAGSLSLGHLARTPTAGWGTLDPDLAASWSARRRGRSADRE